MHLSIISLLAFSVVPLVLTAPTKKSETETADLELRQSFFGDDDVVKFRDGCYDWDDEGGFTNEDKVGRGKAAGEDVIYTHTHPSSDDERRFTDGDDAVGRDQPIGEDSAGGENNDNYEDYDDKNGKVGEDDQNDQL
ncbi:hypothetical protein FRB95_013694 [Tulasnella sp. JGI-2019a]|nr:hypothetical protein FRB93_000681 [Tulasnella sp. JGI-2019a]KAG9034175.1 hypothetical protein FRB95_013694 [Tulasnella sp. JGI-2019a]